MCLIRIRFLKHVLAFILFWLIKGRRELLLLLMTMSTSDDSTYDDDDDGDDDALTYMHFVIVQSNCFNL